MMMSKLYAFIKGMIEFRSSFTTNYDDYGLLLSYDYGREWAHKLTFRRYDD
jgi:hypothetical protein